MLNEIESTLTNPTAVRLRDALVKSLQQHAPHGYKCIFLNCELHQTPGGITVSGDLFAVTTPIFGRPCRNQRVLNLQEVHLLDKLGLLLMAEFSQDHVTLDLFSAFAGAAGAAMYAAVAAGVWWTMQAIAFVQHWGLGSDSVARAGREHLGWEDRCQLQVWLTFGICYHQSHHREPHTPFYRLEPTPASPRMPAGYVVLLLASLVPPVWRALMLPALTEWKKNPTRSFSPGRALICYHRSADVQQ
jgi:hypothetical protein